MKQMLFIEGRRNGYSPEQCGRTMTVAELIAFLENFDEDSLVYLDNDNGYTYGSIDSHSFMEVESEDEDEEEDEEENEVFEEMKNDGIARAYRVLGDFQGEMQNSRDIDELERRGEITHEQAETLRQINRQHYKG